MTSNRLKLAAMKVAGHDPVGELATVLREIERTGDAGARETATTMLAAMKAAGALPDPETRTPPPGYTYKSKNFDTAVIDVDQVLAEALGGAATGDMLRDLLAAVRPHLDDPLTGQSKADHAKLLEHLDELSEALGDLDRESADSADPWRDPDHDALGRARKDAHGRPRNPSAKPAAKKARSTDPWREHGSGRLVRDKGRR